MDDRTNTIAGWVLFSLIVALGSSILVNEFFHTGRPHEMGYPIEGVEVESEEGAAAEQPIAVYLAAADPAQGETVFKKCAVCHTAAKGGPNLAGPNLWGTVGSPHAHAAGFAYSPALKDKPGNWDWDSLSAWLKSPKTFAPGTKMTFAGLSKPEERANLIAWLNQQSDSPQQLPAAPAAASTTENASAPAEDAAGTKAEGEPVLTEGQAAGSPKAGSAARLPRP